MGNQEIKLWDWSRILFGETPPTFMVEVLVRSVVVFLALLVATRALGKRMNGKLTIMETAVMLTLGAIAGNGMQLPQKGILQAIFVLICALVFQRLTSWLETKSPKLETITEGVTTMLVKEGVVQREALNASRISRDQLFSLLRGKGLESLGAVKRVYLEACGVFSVYRRTEPRPGLSLVPRDDQKLQKNRTGAASGLRACKSCGFTMKTSKADERCASCGESDWDDAVI